MSGKARRRSQARKVAAKKAWAWGYIDAGSEAKAKQLVADWKALGEGLANMVLGMDPAVPGADTTGLSFFIDPGSLAKAKQLVDDFNAQGGAGTFDKAFDALKSVDADPEVRRLRYTLNLNRMWPCSPGAL